MNIYNFIFGNKTFKKKKVKYPVNGFLFKQKASLALKCKSDEH